MLKKTTRQLINNELSIYYVTIDNLKNAQKTLNDLLEHKLIACGNIIGGQQQNMVKSLYFWDNKVNADDEVLMILKSRTELREEIYEQLKQTHPYDVPEFISTTINGGSNDYIDWVLQNTKEPHKQDL